MKRVLLIEDDVEQAEAIREALLTAHHIVEVAVNGIEGIEKARRSRPDIVLCDIGLPDIDGDEVARRMRADPDLQSIHLLALTAHALPEDREKAKRAGFDDYIVKPPSFGVLEAKIGQSASERG